MEGGKGSLGSTESGFFLVWICFFQLPSPPDLQRAAGDFAPSPSGSAFVRSPAASAAPPALRPPRSPPPPAAGRPAPALFFPPCPPAKERHMLIPPGAGIFCYCCCGLLRPRQMLRNQGLLKCRCRMLFNDLKVFLLRRPPAPPPPSPPPPLPMPSGAEAAAGAAPPGGRGPGWRAAGGGGGAGSPAAEEWGSPAGEPPASLPSSTSSDDFGKGKAEDRYSLGSSVDSGIRTPLCRICFQGPEQVSDRGRWALGRGPRRARWQRCSSLRDPGPAA